MYEELLAVYIQAFAIKIHRKFLCSMIMCQCKKCSSGVSRAIYYTLTPAECFWNVETIIAPKNSLTVPGVCKVNLKVKWNTTSPWLCSKALTTRSEIVQFCQLYSQKLKYWLPHNSSCLRANRRELFGCQYLLSQRLTLPIQGYFTELGISTICLSRTWHSSKHTSVFSCGQEGGYRLTSRRRILQLRTWGRHAYCDPFHDPLQRHGWQERHCNHGGA